MYSIEKWNTFMNVLYTSVESTSLMLMGELFDFKPKNDSTKKKGKSVSELHGSFLLIFFSFSLVIKKFFAPHQKNRSISWNCDRLVSGREFSELTIFN